MAATKLTLYIPDDDALADLEAFRQLAARRGRSMSALVRLVIRQTVAEARRRGSLPPAAAPTLGADQ